MNQDRDNRKPDWRPSLRSRRAITAWLAGGIGLSAFIFLSVTRDIALGLQFSFCLAALTILSLRWWTAPVHQGIFSYFSPHSIILIHSLFYFGLGNLPALGFPETILINWAQDYYLPAMIYALLGLAVFDLAYRWAVDRLRLNTTLESSLARFHSRRGRRILALLGGVWFLVFIGSFFFLSRRYVMRTYVFIGADGEGENILAQSSEFLLSLSWVFLSIMFFQKNSFRRRALILALVAVFIPIFFGYENRRLPIYLMTLSVGCAFLYRSRPLKLRAGLMIGTALAASFLVLSSLKGARRGDPYLERLVREERNLFQRFRASIQSPQFFEGFTLQRTLTGGFQRRLAGLDWPAAMMEARAETGTPFLWGEHNLAAAAVAVPRLLWPNKPPRGPKAMINHHFELRTFDQLATILGSAYADGGILGVLLGFGLLGFLYPAIIKLISLRQDGILIYLGTLPIIFSFETYLLRQPTRWLRWVLILMAVNSVLIFLYFKLFKGERAADDKQADDPGDVRHLPAGLPIRGADPQPRQSL